MLQSSRARGPGPFKGSRYVKVVARQDSLKARII